MWDTGFYLLPTNKLYKKENTKWLKNFPADSVGSFYRNLADDVDKFIVSDFYSRITNHSDIPDDDVQNIFLLRQNLQKVYKQT